MSDHAYIADGAAVLFPNDGLVFKLNQLQQAELNHFLKKYQVLSKHLQVHNKTYEVISSPTKSDDSHLTPIIIKNPNLHSSCASATQYFNSKINVSNTTERVMATLLTELTFRDVYSLVKIIVFLFLLYFAI